MNLPRREKLILVGILSVGALLRLYRLDLTWFFLDQVRDISTASNIAAGENLPLLGPRVGWVEAYLGPFYFYLLAVPFLFARNPLIGAFFVVLSNLLAIFLLYYFAREHFGSSIALNASALFAVFSLAVISSRVVWNPGLLPLFTLLFIRALYAVIVKGHSRSVIALFVLLAVLTQLHVTAICFAAVALVAFILFRPRVQLAHVFIGLALFVLLYSPYLFYEFSHRFANMRAMVRFVTLDQGLAGQGDFTVVLKNVLLLFRPVLEGFIVEELWPPLILKGFSILYGIEAVLFGLGVVFCLYQLLGSWGKGEAQEVMTRRRLALLLLWLAVPILIVGNKKTGIWWYYLDLLYPSQFIFIAIALSSLSSVAVFPWLQKGLARVAVGLLLALVLFQGSFQIASQQRVDEQGEIILEVPKFSINSTSSSLGTLTSLPFGYRYRILRTLMEDFGVDEGMFSREVHGATLGLPKESEYLVRYLAAQVAGDRGGRVIPAAHYLVAKDSGAGSGLPALRSKRTGPYVIVEYRPLIDYQSWSSVIASGRTLDSLPDHGWKRLELPAANFGLQLREGEALFCKGSLHFSSAGEDVRVAVSIIGEVPLKSIGLQINGRQLVPVAQRVRQSPSLYWTTETVFNFDGFLMPGENPILIEVAGPGRVISFDVYEGSSLHSQAQRMG